MESMIKSMIIRGLPPKTRFKIQRMARSENLSMNQMIVRLLLQAVAHSEREKDEKAIRSEAFRRLDEFRERRYRKYGKMEDSTKIIREFRDNRSR